MSLAKKRNVGLLPRAVSMIDNFFKDDWEDAFPRWTSSLGLKPTMTVPSANVSDTEKSYSLELAVPGMKKDDFKIEIDNGVLSISAEESKEKEEKDDDYTRKEYSYSSFCRFFWLPEGTMEDKIEANYKDGILKITVPKSEMSIKKEAKTIAIA